MATQFDHRSHLDEGHEGNPWLFAIPFFTSLIALVAVLSVWFTLR